MIRQRLSPLERRSQQQHFLDAIHLPTSPSCVNVLQVLNSLLFHFFLPVLLKSLHPSPEFQYHLHKASAGADSSSSRPVSMQKVPFYILLPTSIFCCCNNRFLWTSQRYSLAANLKRRGNSWYKSTIICINMLFSHRLLFVYYTRAA